MEITVRRELLNPRNVVHGGVIYALADTGMGAALYRMLDEGKSCATINCSIS
ncbi:MAG: PaaI family thioesterase [Hyphomicrobiales bacterium]|nr:PaaI family thioesterase [Hyphomicrobiales bacterium]